MEKRRACDGKEGCQCESCFKSGRYLLTRTQLSLNQEQLADPETNHEAVPTFWKEDYSIYVVTLIHILMIISNIVIAALIVKDMMSTPLPDEITIANRTYTIDKYKILSVARKSV